MAAVRTERVTAHDLVLKDNPSAADAPRQPKGRLVAAIGDRAPRIDAIFPANSRIIPDLADASDCEERTADAGTSCNDSQQEKGCPQ